MTIADAQPAAAVSGPISPRPGDRLQRLPLRLAQPGLDLFLELRLTCQPAFSAGFTDSLASEGCSHQEDDGEVVV
jgi:hypothetical protein